MKLFRVLFAFDALALLVLAYFFVDGMRYEPGAEYLGIWFPLLFVPAAVLVGSWALSSKGKTGTANVLLGILAAPFVLCLLFIGLFVVLQPDMR